MVNRKVKKEIAKRGLRIKKIHLKKHNFLFLSFLDDGEQFKKAKKGEKL